MGTGQMTDTTYKPPYIEKAERNARVQARYDELMAEGKHGHYETMFRVVREEVERERQRVVAGIHWYDNVEKFTPGEIIKRLFGA